MLGIDRRAASYTWTAAVVLILLGSVYLIRQSLFAFVVALLFAYLLSPLVDLLARILPGRRTRTLALVLAYVIVIGVLLFGVVALGTRIVAEANNLGETLKSLGKASEPVHNPSWVDPIVGYVREQIRAHAGDVVSYLPKAGLQALSIAGDLIWIVVVPILSFFFLKDGRMMMNALLDLIDDGPHRALAEDIVKDINVLLAQYMRALMVLSLFTLTFFSFYLSVTRVPYALLLAAVAAVLEFIPLIGPLLAAVVIVSVAGFSGYDHLLWILGFLGLYRLFQDYVLSPRLMSEGVELHPLLVLFGVFAGGEIGGVAGTFLSVPVLALARILYRRLAAAHRQTELAQANP